MNNRILNITGLEKFILAKLSKELSQDLTYHNVHHTEAVLSSCREYIKRMKIKEHDAFLLETAALMHDTGYMEAIDNHEEKSKDYARYLLPDWNYSPDEIEKICGMIEATKIPQKPTTNLEQIIADSDLDYLGTSWFYSISKKLYFEMLALNKISNKIEWNDFQIRFMKNHRYHTSFAKKYREPVKQKHLEELVDKWS